MKEAKHTINLRHAMEKLWANKIKFIIVWAVTFVLSCIIILPVPRYYNCTISMAPESNNDNYGSQISSLAASFGFSFAKGGNDAISPTLYPDLFKSTGFLVSLLDIEVTTSDGEETMDYYTYMATRQKENPWKVPTKKLKKFIHYIATGEPEPAVSKIDSIDAFRLNRFDTGVIKSISEKIRCSVDKKTNVITLSITAQDPLIAATLAVEIEKRLQTFITDYRTKKSRIDYDYYTQLTDSASQAYSEALEAHSTYADSHLHTTWTREQNMLKYLQGEVNMKSSIYTAMNSRKEAAMAKLQDHTPVFTTIRTATVPAKPAGPKRMIFVASMLMLATIVMLLWMFRQKIAEILFTDPE